jgi:propionate CoA-transferase
MNTHRKLPLLTAAEAGAMISSNAVVTVSGVVGSLVPEATLRALGERFEASGEPRGLVAILPVAVGDVFDAPGVDHLAHAGMLKTVIGGSFVYGVNPVTGGRPALPDLIRRGDVEAFNFSIGVIIHALRERAAGRPGLITRVGLGTFQDPRVEGGRLNAATPDAFVSVLSLDGEEYLRYELPPPDTAILRGSAADEFGNVVMTREVTNGAVLVQAIAAHNAGGTVIAEVEHLVEGGSLNPRSVAIPAPLVDAVVVAPGGQQATGVTYDPYLSGEFRAPHRDRSDQLRHPVSTVLDRASRYLQTGDLVILGFGMPSMLPLLDALPPDVRFAVEHGAIGGVPSGGLVFGGAVNADAVIDTPSMFDLIDGGGCDVACLGFAEVGPDGAVNVSSLPTHLPGSGGFTNITASTGRLIFCGTFTAGGLETELSDGAVRIVKEGRHRKFVNHLRQRTFAPRASRAQNVAYITDRCVLELRDDALTVAEVYPGVDLQRDVLDQAEYPLEVVLAAEGRAP